MTVASGRPGWRQAKPGSPESENVQSLERRGTSEASGGKSSWEETWRSRIGLGTELGLWHGGSVGEYLFSVQDSISKFCHSDWERQGDNNRQW